MKTIFLIVLVALGTSVYGGNNDTVIYSGNDKVCDFYLNLLRSERYVVEDEQGNVVGFDLLRPLLFRMDTVYHAETETGYTIQDAGISCLQISKIAFVSSSQKQPKIGAYIELYSDLTGSYLETKILWIRL